MSISISGRDHFQSAKSTLSGTDPRLVHGSVSFLVTVARSDRIRASARFQTSASHSIWVWVFAKTRSYQGYCSQL
jgi:hypothetical protein